MQGASVTYDRRARAVVGAAGELRDRIGLGMENILLRLTALVFADVLKAHGGAVVAIGDDTLVLDDEGAYLTALAIGVLSPDARHTEVGAIVEGELLVILITLWIVLTRGYRYTKIRLCARMCMLFRGAI